MVWHQTLSLTGFHIHIYEPYELSVKFISKLYKTKLSDKIHSNHGVINSLNNGCGWSYSRYNRKRYCIWKLFALYRLSNRNKRKLCGPSLHELWCRLQLPNALFTYFQAQENVFHLFSSSGKLRILGLLFGFQNVQY